MLLVTLALIGSVSRSGDPVCHPLAEPKHLPGLDVVMDSAGLVGRLQAIDSTAGRGVTVSILMAKSPSGIIFAGPAAQGEQVLTAVLASLRPPSKATPQAFRVNVQLGTAPGIALERSVLCNPQTVAMDPVRVPFTIGVVRTDGGTMSGSGASSRPRSISPRLRIDKEGQVLEVSLGSGSGVPEADERIREITLAQRFRPALLDGRPVEVWVSGSRIELIL